MVMPRAALALFLAALCWPSAAIATGERLLPVDPPADAISDGERLIWHDGRRVRTLDPATGRRRAFVAQRGCGLMDAAAGGVTLFECGEGAYRVLELRSGRWTQAPPIRGYLEAFGRHWVKTFVNYGCYHCDSFVYTNWRTGQEHEVDYMDDPVLDLRSRSLPRLHGATVAVAGRSSVLSFRARHGEGEVLVVQRGKSRRWVARCNVCESVSLRGGRLAWIDVPKGGAATLHRFDLRTGRRWRWRLPSRHAQAWRAGPGLYVSSDGRLYRTVVDQR